MKFLLKTPLLLLFFLSSCYYSKREKLTPITKKEPSLVTSRKSTPVLDSVILKPHFDPRSQKIDKFFKKKFGRKLFNGTVLFAEKGHIVHKAAYGYSNLRKKNPLKINSKFQLASVSKPFTAYGILLLIDRGKIELDTDIRTYLGEEFPYENITVRNLLSHRSGLSNYMYFADDYWPNRRTTITNRDIYDIMVEFRPNTYYKPNVRYNYSNTGYMLLALIIENVSKMSYAEFMHTQIFYPLGMYNSTVYKKSTDPKNCNEVIGYQPNRRIASNTYLNGVVGDKGIYSNVDDLYLFDKAITNGTLVSKKTLEVAFVPVHRDLRIYDNYGLGWRINAKDTENKLIYHTGWWKGFRTYFIRELGTKRTIIILNNTTRGRFLSLKELRGLMEENENPKITS